MGDQLTKISRKDLPQLRDKYKDRDVKNYLTFVTIDTYIRWFQQDPDVKHIQFYCVNDDLSHGTFVVTVSLRENSSKLKFIGFIYNKNQHLGS